MTKPRVKVPSTGGFVSDGLMNVIAGLGGANPRTAADVYSMAEYVESVMVNLDAAYRTSTWFGKIVDIPADDATREWRSWQAPKEVIARIEAEETRLGVQHKVRQALIGARKDGGCALVFGGLPGLINQPLAIDAIKPGSVTFLSVIPKALCNPSGELQRDPELPGYNEPLFYTIGGKEFHGSRVCRIIGRDIMNGNPQSAAQTQGWGDSIWLQMAASIKSADAASAVLDSMLKETKVDVVSIHDFMASLANKDYEAQLIKRFQTFAMLKSISNVSLLDKDDEWQQKQINWQGIPDVVMLMLTIMAGAADIPLTRLLGTSAKGLNATGDGDLKNYYDKVGADQKLRISPMLATLDAIIKRSAAVTDPKVWYVWNPLWQQTAKERAEVEKMYADAATALIGAALMPEQALADAVQNRMIESGSWPGLEDAIKTHGSDVPEPAPDPAEPDDPAAIGDAGPRSLYVRRDVINAAEITKWAKAQGFVDIVPDLHVTIMYSPTPVDWMKCGESWSGELKINPGGPRILDTFDGDAKVLLFNSAELRWRHDDMKRAGAMPTYDDYQPHITISYGKMPADAEPYQGKIVLGPEIFSDAD